MLSSAAPLDCEGLLYLGLDYSTARLHSATSQAGERFISAFDHVRRQLSPCCAVSKLQGVLQLVIQERRVMCATLHVDVSNAPALGLYRKAGFVEVCHASTAAA